MRRTEKKSHNRIWLLVLLLVVAIAATTVAVVSMLGGFQPDDSGAISLVNPDVESAPSDADSAPQVSDTSEEQPEQSDDADTSQQAPSISISDHQTEWTTETRVEIFKSTYENGERVVTVKSDNGDKVVAPGTANAYTFKLKNTHVAALDYEVTVDVTFSPAEVEVPLVGRLTRYDGVCVWDSGDSLTEWNGVIDKATLATGNYSYYTFEWEWPIDGDDRVDTQLGNLFLEQDVSFALTIKTTATESADPHAQGGISAPPTGDSTRYALWFGLLGGTAMVLVLLLLTRDKEEKRKRTEATGIE